MLLVSAATTCYRFNVALRLLFPAEQMPETGSGLPGVPQPVNFEIAVSIACCAWQRGLARLFGHGRQAGAFGRRLICAKSQNFRIFARLRVPSH